MHSKLLFEDMGCCCCRPLAEVEQDPSVSFHTDVGNIAIVHGIVSKSIQGCCNGVMYVKDGVLYYETKYGSSRLCCKCARDNFPLSEIQTVELVQNQAVRYQSTKYILLSPGLKITLSGGVVLAAIPDAAVFSQQLLKACNLSPAS